MTPYKNLSGNSSVVGYEIEDEAITVWFEDSKNAFRYSYEGKAGKKHVDNLKKLAEFGDGLSTYINFHLRYEND